MSEFRLLIVEDDVLIAEEISEICTGQGYDVVDVAHNAGHAITTLQTSQIDMVLLDVNLEDDIDGIDVAEFIVDKINVPFIYITSYANTSVIERAKKTKPIGYIVKPFNIGQLVSTLEISLYNYSQKQMPGGLDLEAINKTLMDALTEREFSVLNHIFHGKTNKQMAAQEYLSINTIKYHIKQLYVKFDANSRSSLLARVRELN